VILYLDASALVKRYVAERGSGEVVAAVAAASWAGTAVISRAETAAALAKAVRMGIITQEDATAALTRFQREWPHFIRLQVTEALVARAAALAWSHGLRGYDAVHLAAALTWQDAMGQPVRVATFDRLLWQAARQAGLEVFPEEGWFGEGGPGPRA
jgi:predicted nucleic acid-binding protein